MKITHEVVFSLWHEPFTADFSAVYRSGSVKHDSHEHDSHDSMIIAKLLFSTKFKTKTLVAFISDNS